jgi:peptide/nickel transport system substrate-binding protein
MPSWKLLFAGFCLMLSAAGQAAAEHTLGIGLADDPDILNPTIARTFTGRIVFAALCDKLLDISPELNIVPQLATE